MGIFDKLTNSRARKKNENRIKRKSRTSKTFPNPDVQIDKVINEYGNKVYTRGRKAWNNMQSRKSEGKQILKRSILHGIGESTRFVAGESEAHKKRRLSKQ